MRPEADRWALPHHDAACFKLPLRVVGLAPLLLIVWPFLDRSPERHPLKRPVSIAIGVLVVLSLLVFGMLGYLSESTRTVFGRTVQFDIYGMPHAPR